MADISLTEEQAEHVRELVACGQFTSAGEAVRAALAEWLPRQDIRRLWQEGIDSGLADPNLTAADVKTQARTRRDRHRQR